MKFLSFHNKNSKGEIKMKNTKLKVLVVALAICMLAISAFSTLAWFTATDSVTNDFFIANSEDDPNKIFSVDVWEDSTPEDSEDEEKIQTGIEFNEILPGDKLYKEAHIENTSSYPQYIRATITISDASVWQDVYGVRVVPLTDFVDGIKEDAIHTMVSYYDAVNDSFVYQLYYTDILAVKDNIVVFDYVNIDSRLDQYQAAELAGSFSITVVADAVQTKNVGANVYEAFETVGLVKAVPISDPAKLAEALASDDEAYIIIDAAALTNNTLTIDSAIANKTLDFNGQNVQVVFAATASAENVVVSNIVDTDGLGYSVITETGFAGDLAIVGCSFKDNKGEGCVSPKSGNVTIDNCEFTGRVDVKTYGVRANGRTGDLTITNCSFNDFKSWTININGGHVGNLTVDNCTFNTPDGVLKTLFDKATNTGVTGDFTFTNNTMTAKGHDGNINFVVVTGSGNGPVVAGGTKTVTGNTLNGEAWTQA